MGFLLYLCITVFIAICFLLILIILIQKGRGGGLASAFGGGAGGHSAFGSKTGDVLTWVTSIIFGIFLLLAIFLNLLSEKYNKRQVEAATGIQQPTQLPGNTPVMPTPAPEQLPVVPTSQPGK